MKTICFLLFSFLMGSAAFAQIPMTPFYAGPLEGVWRTVGPVSSNPALSVSIGLRFNQNLLEVTAFCTAASGQKMSATTASPVFFKGNEVHVLKAGWANASLWGLNCTATTTRTVLYYNLNGDMLEVYDYQTGNVFNFKKIF